MNLYDAQSWREAVERGWWRRPWWDDEAIPTGKPVLLSVGVFDELSDPEWKELFGLYLTWKGCLAATLAGTGTFEVRAANGKRVWITDTGPVITISYPDEA